MPARHLAAHLNDHLAVVTGTEQLAARMAAQYGDDDLGRLAAGLRPRLREQAAEIERVLRDRGLRPDRAKQGGAWLAEKAGRLKPNGSLRGRSPVTPLVEVEGLLLGLEALALLWRNLGEAAGALGLDGNALAAALARVEADRAAVEARRPAVARAALTAE